MRHASAKLSEAKFSARIESSREYAVAAAVAYNHVNAHMQIQLNKFKSLISFGLRNGSDAEARKKRAFFTELLKREAERMAKSEANFSPAMEKKQNQEMAL